MHGPFKNLKIAQPLGTRAENQKFDWSMHQILNGSGICHGYRALVKFVEIWFSKSDIWMTSEICLMMLRNLKTILFAEKDATCGSLQNLGNSASNQILSSIATYLQAFWGGGRKQQNLTKFWHLKSEIWNLEFDQGASFGPILA